MAVNAFSFEDGEEIFRHGVVIRVSPSWHGRRNAVRFSQVKVCLRGVLESLVARGFLSLSVFTGSVQIILGHLSITVII